MNTVDCTWELINLGVKTCEISFDKGEKDLSELLLILEKDYKYIVVKAPVGDYANYSILSNNYYSFNESVIGVEKQFQTFVEEDKYIKYYLKRSTLLRIESVERMQSVLDKIDTSMFNTDRIALNPYFGCEVANRRYRNWICQEYNAESYLFEIEFNKQVVGFCLMKIDGSSVVYLLGGIYPSYKGLGVGLLIPLAPYLFAKNYEDIVLMKVKTHISSNNMEIVRCYTNLGYSITSIDYVFSKLVNL